MGSFFAVAPFVIAALAGAALAFFELLKTFQRNIGSALRNRWGLTLLVVNAGFPLVVYAIVRYVFNVDDGIWMAILIGFTFPVILRSRFTLYRQVGKKEDPGLAEFSLKLDQAYQSLQDLCYYEVNAVLAEELDALADAINKKLSPKELETKIRNPIDAERMPATRQEHEQRLQDILEKHKDDPRRRHHALALFLVDISTPRGIHSLLAKT